MVITHQRAAWTCPGRIPQGMNAPFFTDGIPLKFCEKCPGEETWKPVRAHHCQECGYCIFKMDHHCSWINNCVGHRNMKYFCQFIIYTCLSSAYLSLLMAVSFYQLLSAKKPKLHMNKKEYPTVFIMSILAFVEGLLFAYFCWELC